MHEAYLSIGSNMGDRLGYLQQAVRSVRSADEIEDVSTSALYSTAPWGGIDQESFFNAALRLKTSLSPHALLHLCQRIEQEAGRVRIVHWGARTLDLDILLFDEEQIHDAELIIPHPYLMQRRFVLQPLSDVAEGAVKTRCLQWLASCPDTGAVVQIFPSGAWEDASRFI